MKKRKIIFALGLSLLPIGKPFFIGTSIFLTNSLSIYSSTVKAETRDADFFYDIHIYSNYTLIALISLHILAVSIHRVLFKENILKRIT